MERRSLVVPAALLLLSSTAPEAFHREFHGSAGIVEGMSDAAEGETSPPDLETPKIAFLAEGPVPASVREHAEQMVQDLARKAPRPIIFARVKIRMETGRDPDDQAVVQATMDVSGEPIRAQVSAPNPEEALNALTERMDRRIRKLAERRQDTVRRPPATPEGSWRSGDLAASRPSFYPRPREERRLVRRKTFAPHETISPEEAIFDLDVLDHRFFLFTNSLDGEVSIVYEDDGEVRLRRLSGGSPTEDDAEVPVSVDPTPAPDLAVEEARDRLDVTEEPFVFFRNRNTGEANVLYRRYDGHYGLIEPKVDA